MPKPSKAKANAPIVLFAFTVLMIFNVALPKAGVVAGGVPITFGYVILGVFATFGLLNLARHPLPPIPPIMQVIVGFLPMALFTFAKIHTNSTGTTPIFIFETMFLVLPVAILVVFSAYLEDLSEDEILSRLRWCLRFVVIWGMMNFFLWAVAHAFVKIPYITVNGDALDIFSKNNRRGSLMKLVATYNNGNVYGAAMVMLMPLALYSEKSPIWKGLFIGALLLTLSRSAWIGMLAVFILMIALGLIKINRASVWIVVGGCILCLATLLPIMGWTSDKIVDSNLGGRASQFESVIFTPLGGTDIGVAEIVYLGLIDSFGVFGMIPVMLALAWPLIYAIRAWRTLSVFRRSAVASCAGYLLMCGMDGAFVFPPVFAIFLFVSALVYRRGQRPARRTSGAVSPFRQGAVAPDRRAVA